MSFILDNKNTLKKVHSGAYLNRTNIMTLINANLQLTELGFFSSYYDREAVTQLVQKSNDLNLLELALDYTDKRYYMEDALRKQFENKWTVKLDSTTVRLKRKKNINN